MFSGVEWGDDLGLRVLSPCTYPHTCVGDIKDNVTVYKDFMIQQTARLVPGGNY